MAKVSTWQNKRIGDVAKISSGKVISSKEITNTYSPGLFPCYGGNGLRGYVKNYLYDGIYPIIGRVGALCGNVHLVRGRFYPTEHALVCSIKTDDNPRFIEYLLKSMNLNQYAKGVAQPVLSASTVSELTAYFPSVIEQQRIVEELDLLSRVIELKNAQLHTLEDLSSAIFHEMFGDILSNEKMWETSTFGNEFKIYSGGTPDTKQPAYWENGNISWIGSNLCQNLVLYHNDGKFITEEGLSHSSAKVFSENFVLVALVGATIGKSALLRFRTTTNQNVAGIDVPSNDSYTSEFVYMMMRGLYPLFMNVSNGKFKMANLSFVRSLPIIKPPLSLQETFSERFSVIQRQKSNVEKSIVVAENLLASRMDKYFNE